MTQVAPLTPWVSGAEVAQDTRLTGLTLPAWLSWDMVAMAATEFLWSRTGRQFNSETRTIRPHRLASSCGCGVGWIGQAMGPTLSWWVSGGCGCDSSFDFLLPGPARDVSVVVEGVAFTQWALYDGQRLVRQDGLPWPCCQALSSPAGGAGTWGVTLTIGVDVPDLLTMATAEFAVETALHFTNKGSRLPLRTTSTTRDGITIQVAPTTKDGSTNIPLVDWAINAFNPKGLARRPSVSSPDVPVGARQ